MKLMNSLSATVMGEDRKLVAMVEELTFKRAKAATAPARATEAIIYLEVICLRLLL